MLRVPLTESCPSYHKDAEGQTLSRLDVVDAAFSDDHGQQNEAELEIISKKMG